MKRNIIMWLLILLIPGLIAFMVYDLFYSDSRPQNPYEPIPDNAGRIDEELIAYTEIKQIKTGLSELNGIAVDVNDNIVIAGNEVVIFDADFNQLNWFTLSETSSCVAVNSKSEIFLGIRNRIEVWDFNGSLANKWDLKNSGSIITGMAATDRFIYVADADARVVYQYDTDGEHIADLGKGDDEKAVPNIIIRSGFFDISIGRNEELWIANPGRFSLQAFNEKGDFLSSWGKQSNAIDGFCGCCNPTNFAVFGNGDFVTSEKSIPRVKTYSPDGKFLNVVATPEQFDKGTKGLDLAVDSKNRIYILDPARKLVRIFEKNKSSK